MHCPKDNTQLQIATREGIEIDYCPECRGVFLERGELEKIIERASYGDAQQYDRPPQRREREYREHDGDDDEDFRSRDDRSYHNNDDHNKRHKKESFLGNLFDF